MSGSKRPAPTAVVAVLGIDGSGKSTLSHELAERYSARGRVVRISDSAELFDGGNVVDLGPLLTEHLRRRIADHAKRARSLSDYKVPKIADLVLRDRLVGEVKSEYRPRVIVLDGMPALNMTAWTILYHDDGFNEDTCAAVLSALTGRVDDPADAVFERFPELGRLRELGYTHMHVPDAVIFLDVPAEVCAVRIEARGKAKQAHERVEMLERLRGAYMLVCDVLRRSWDARVLVLDGDRDVDRVIFDARVFIDEVLGG